MPWKPPSLGFIKINVDATVFRSSDQFSVGLVGRDHVGAVLFAEGRIMQGAFSSKTAELFALREGLSMAIRMGWENVVVESDSVQAIKEVSDPSLFSPDNPVAEQILSLGSSFVVVEFHHCNRKANQVAHELARVCFRNGSHLLFLFAVPLCISKYVMMDIQG